MNTLTVEQMRNAYFAQRTQDMAEAQGWSVDSEMASMEYTDEDKEKYLSGVKVLESWRFSVSYRSVIAPEAGENQIVVSAGHIATSPAYALVTFKRRIVPHKGGRTAKRSLDVTPETNERLRLLREQYGVSLGDLVEAASADMLEVLTTK